MGDKENNGLTSQVNIEILKSLLDFLARLAMPLCILIFLVLYKPAINDLLNKTNSAEFLGVNLSFENNDNGFKGQLSAKAIYYLINSGLSKNGVRYETPEVKKAIDELKDKGLITWKTSEVSIESSSASIVVIFATPTNEGWQLLVTLGITPYQTTNLVTSDNSQLLASVNIDWASYPVKKSAIGGIDSNNAQHPYANCYSTDDVCEVMIVKSKLPITKFIIFTPHKIKSFITTLFKKENDYHELIPVDSTNFTCELIEKEALNYCIESKI